MKKYTIIFAIAALGFACGGDENNGNNNGNNGSNNGTGGSNNGTSGSNNGTTGGMNNGVEDPEPTCENYCTLALANCSTEYSSEAECLDYCENVAAWETGTRGDTMGNSIACRIYHGNGPAAADAATHCPHAGRTGGDACGTWCENYCQLAGKNCTDANSLYNNDADCMTACTAFETTGLPGDVQYDTVQCRLYHLGAPAATNPGTHCGHGAETPTSECVGSAAAFVFRTDTPDQYTQIDNLGMPAVSTALISTSKEAYNAASPTNENDNPFVGELAGGISFLHYGPNGTSDINTNLGTGEGLDEELIAAFGVTPCLASAPTGPTCATQEVIPGVRVLDLVVPDRLKILDTGADAGFPNGRVLADPVIDITLAVILLDLSTHTPADLIGQVNPRYNDLGGAEGAFLTQFPYLHPPHEPAP